MGVVREAYEETAVELAPKDVRHFRDFWVDTRGKQFNYHLFYTIFDSRPIVKIDQNQHTKYKWIPINDCLKEKLVSDHPACMKMFLQEMHSYLTQ